MGTNAVDYEYPAGLHYQQLSTPLIVAGAGEDVYVEHMALSNTSGAMILVALYNGDQTVFHGFLPVEILTTNMYGKMRFTDGLRVLGTLNLLAFVFTRE